MRVLRVMRYARCAIGRTVTDVSLSISLTRTVSQSVRSGVNSVPAARLSINVSFADFMNRMNQPNSAGALLSLLTHQH